MPMAPQSLYSQLWERGGNRRVSRVCPSVTLSHVGPKGCHLAGTHMWPQVYTALHRGPGPSGERKFGGRHPEPSRPSCSQIHVGAAAIPNDSDYLVSNYYYITH